MTVLKQVERSATVAFCPHANLLALGTVAGAIDMSFSTSSVLEVCDLLWLLGTAAAGAQDLRAHVPTISAGLSRGLCLVRTSTAACGVSTGAGTFQQACMGPARRSARGKVTCSWPHQQPVQHPQHALTRHFNTLPCSMAYWRVAWRMGQWCCGTLQPSLTQRPGWTASPRCWQRCRSILER